VTRLLIVDDSALVRKLIGQVFAAEAGFEVAFARNGVEALSQLQSFRPDVITLDIQMPEMGGLECLDRIMVERPCPVVMVSSLSAEGAATTLEALNLGAVDFISKPGGTASLHMDTWGPELAAKVRAAAGARIKSSRRLQDRIRHLGEASRVDLAPSARFARMQGFPSALLPEPTSGEGLVLVGVSTGGPPALEALLSPLPASFPWPILVAQHMPESFTGPLARRLDRLCALNVLEVVEASLLEPGSVYLARGDADLVVARQRSRLVALSTPSRPEYPWRPSADRLVRSAMEHVPPRQLIGVLMTGMGNDGAEAMTQLKANGGRTIAESDETAVVWGMPGELVKAGGADWILPLGGIAPQLQALTP
jgi:two-component system chemotaxis response regulator CheB